MIRSWPFMNGTARRIIGPMQNFKRGDVIRVPFPYTDRNTRQYRPALVVSPSGIGEDNALLWVVMITSADNLPWPNDIPLGDRYGQTGLPAPSVIRPVKIATIKARHAEFIGQVGVSVMQAVEQVLMRNLGV